MKIGIRILATIVLAIVHTAVAGQPGKKPARPNIIFIMPDNIGRDWIGAYGSEEKVTPNLDRMASRGLQFDIFWNMPTCVPSRIGLLTGKYPCNTGWVAQAGITKNGSYFFDWNREVTFARVLREAGYATAVGGKWQVNDLRMKEEVLRLHGFDQHCVWPGFEPGNPVSSQRYWDPYYITNGERQQLRGRFGPDVLSDFVLGFIEKNRDKPFALYYPMNLCHAPFVNTPENKAGSGLSEEAKYRGMVHYMDYLIGRLYRHLEKLGLLENTIIMFTSDHSGPPAEHPGSVSWKGGTGPLRDHRRAQTPFIVHWPAAIKTGKRTTEFASIIDVFPTLMQAAGITVPDSLKLDGLSLVPFMKGETATTRPWNYSQVTREIALRWVRDQRYLLYSNGRLYDLISDPEETNNLIASKEIAVVKARKKLQGILQQMPEDKKVTYPK